MSALRSNENVAGRAPSKAVDSVVTANLIAHGSILEPTKKTTPERKSVFRLWR